MKKILKGIGLFLILPLIPFYFVWSSKKIDSKKKIIYTIAILFVYIVISVFRNPGELSIGSNKVVIELGEAFSVRDYLLENQRDNTDLKILSNVDLSKVGQYNIEYIIDGKNKELVIQVKDTTKPVIIVKDVEISTSESILAKDFVVSYSDESPVSFSFIKEPDWNKSGKYEAEIEAKDASGNTSIARFFITIEDKSLQIKYMEEISEWSINFGKDLGEFGRILQNNDLNSSVWKKSLKDSTLKLNTNCFLLPGIEPTKEFEIGHKYLELACDSYFVGFDDLKKGVDKLDESLINSGVLFIENGHLNLDKGMKEIERVALSLNINK